MADEITMDKTYKTRKGLPVRVLAVDIRFGGFVQTVAALVDYGDREALYTFTASGHFLTGGDHDLDLIEVKPGKVVWIVVYEDKTTATHGVLGDAISSQNAYGGTIHKVILNEDNEVK